MFLLSFHSRFSRHYVGHHNVNFTIFCEEFQGELSRYFVSSRVNYLDLFEEFHCELSRYIVGRLMVNYLDNLLEISL